MSNNNEPRSGINPTVAFVTVAGLVALAIIGASIIFLVRPDASATFINSIVIVIGLAISFAGTVGVITPIARKTSKVEAAVEQVRSQTNGTLSAKDAEITRLQKQVSELGGNPHDQ